MASLVYGLICGIVMFCFSAYFDLKRISWRTIIFDVHIAGSFLVAGYFSWYLIIARKKHFGIMRRILVGIATNVLSYCFMWLSYIIFLVFVLFYRNTLEITGTCLGTLSVNILSAFYVSGLFTIALAYVFSFLALPLACLVACFFGSIKVRRKLKISA